MTFLFGPLLALFLISPVLVVDACASADNNLDCFKLDILFDLSGSAVGCGWCNTGNGTCLEKNASTARPTTTTCTNWNPDFCNGVRVADTSCWLADITLAQYSLRILGVQANYGCGWCGGQRSCLPKRLNPELPIVPELCQSDWQPQGNCSLLQGCDTCLAIRAILESPTLNESIIEALGDLNRSDPRLLGLSCSYEPITRTCADFPGLPPPGWTQDPSTCCPNVGCDNCRYLEELSYCTWCNGTCSDSLSVCPDNTSALCGTTCEAQPCAQCAQLGRRGLCGWCPDLGCTDRWSTLCPTANQTPADLVLTCAKLSDDGSCIPGLCTTCQNRLCRVDVLNRSVVISQNFTLEVGYIDLPPTDWITFELGPNSGVIRTTACSTLTGYVLLDASLLSTGVYNETLITSDSDCLDSSELEVNVTGAHDCENITATPQRGSTTRFQVILTIETVPGCNSSSLEPELATWVIPVTTVVVVVGVAVGLVIGLLIWKRQSIKKSQRIMRNQMLAEAAPSNPSLYPLSPPGVTRREPSSSGSSSSLGGGKQSSTDFDDNAPSFIHSFPVQTAAPPEAHQASQYIHMSQLLKRPPPT